MALLSGSMAEKNLSNYKIRESSVSAKFYVMSRRDESSRQAGKEAGGVYI